MRRLLLAGVAVFALTANVGAKEKDAGENTCASTESAATIIDSMNYMLKKRDVPFTVVDIGDATTLPLQGGETMSCHVTVEFNFGGIKVPGTFKVRVNAAGREVEQWQEDSSTPRRGKARGAT